MLEFILSNIYWVVIIGFALVSFFNKGKSGAGQRPKGGMPTFGGGGEAPDRRSVDESGYSKDEEKYPTQPVYQSTSGVSENERDQERRELERERERAMDLIRRSDRPERFSLVEDKEDSYSEIPTVTSSPQPLSPLAKDAAKGIIWSEILGPPRAKRGFHKRNS